MAKGMTFQISAGDKPDGVDFTKLEYVDIGFVSVPITPRDFGHNYDTWDEYYDVNGRPWFCDCCGHVIYSDEE